MSLFWGMFLLCSFVITQADSGLKEARALFFAATNDDGIKRFYKETERLQGNSDLEKAYKGVATAMYASVVASVFDKLSYFNKGKGLIEEAVRGSADNPEIRFLRFALQANTPAMLGYNGNLKDDSRFIIEALEKGRADYKSDYWKKAIRFMQNSDKLDKHNKEKLNQMISK